MHVTHISKRLAWRNGLFFLINTMTKAGENRRSKVLSFVKD